MSTLSSAPASGGCRAVITSRGRRAIHPRCRAVSVHLRRRTVVVASSSVHFRRCTVIGVSLFSDMLHFQIYFSFQFQRVAICLKIVKELCDGAP